MNLTNSSTRFPEGDAMQNPRTGSILSAGFSAAARFRAPASSRQRHVFKNLVFAVTFDVSTVQCSSVWPHPSGGSDRLRGGGPGGLLPVFRPDDLAHEFDGELGVLVGEFDPYGFAIDHGQL